MFARLVFYPTLLYNVVMEKIVPRRNWYDRIDNTVVLGALPFKHLTEKILKENVKGVVAMNEPYELRLFANNKEEWEQCDVEFLHLPTIDMGVSPTEINLTKGVEFINRIGDSGGSVYVHCKAGRSRSATLVACYLMQKHKWTPQEAVTFMETKRSHIVLRSAMWNALHAYHDKNISDKN